MKLIKSSNGDAAQTASVKDLQVNGAASVFSPAATPECDIGPAEGSTTGAAGVGAAFDTADENDVLPA